MGLSDPGQQVSGLAQPRPQKYPSPRLPNWEAAAGSPLLILLPRPLGRSSILLLDTEQPIASSNPSKPGPLQLARFLRALPLPLLNVALGPHYFPLPDILPAAPATLWTPCAGL